MTDWICSQCGLMHSEHEETPRMMDWLKNRFCPKCQGEGWLWAHELDEYYGGDGHSSPRTDDTRYPCDHACHFDVIHE